MPRKGNGTHRRGSGANDDGNGANVGFERQLWSAADLLRGNMDPGEYKHVVLGLIFLKYISDAFDARRSELERESAAGADPEDPDEYRSEHVFWVPAEARWARLRDAAKTPEIGQPSHCGYGVDDLIRRERCADGLSPRGLAITSRSCAASATPAQVWAAACLCTT